MDPSSGGELDLEALDSLETGDEDALLLGALALERPGARDGETERSGGCCIVRGGRLGTWTTCQTCELGGLTCRNISL